MFSYAASYFGDPDAQYHLGAALSGRRLAAPKDPVQAARWFGLAANKGQCQAPGRARRHAVQGRASARQAALGLIWLTLAKDGAGAGGDVDRRDLRRAFAQASDDERALALCYLENWLKRAAA